MRFFQLVRTLVVSDPIQLTARKPPTRHKPNHSGMTCDEQKAKRLATGKCLHCRNLREHLDLTSCDACRARQRQHTAMRRAARKAKAQETP